MRHIKRISRNAKTNIPIVLISTGLVFILLLLTMIISNGIIIFCVNSGFITGRPGGTPLLPFLLQSGILSIFIGVILTLVLSHFPLRPVSRLINAIHAVAAGNFHVKIRIKHPKEFRELAESFNQMTDELAGIEMLRSYFIYNFSHEFRTPIMSVQGFARLIKKGDLPEISGVPERSGKRYSSFLLHPGGVSRLLEQYVRGYTDLCPGGRADREVSETTVLTGTCKKTAIRMTFPQRDKAGLPGRKYFLCRTAVHRTDPGAGQRGSLCMQGRRTRLCNTERPAEAEAGRRSGAVRRERGADCRTAAGTGTSGACRLLLWRRCGCAGSIFLRCARL